jgi:hypothetical protein
MLLPAIQDCQAPKRLHDVSTPPSKSHYRLAGNSANQLRQNTARTIPLPMNDVHALLLEGEDCVVHS